MFEVNDNLIYTPGGVRVTVVEIYSWWMILRDDATDEILPPVYEDEYELYQAA